MDYGNKIRDIRYNNGLSQEDMAKILKINRNCLSRIETDKSLPNADTLYKIAKNFNVSIDNMLGINKEDNENINEKNKKINKISQYLSYLNNDELDFILNVLYVMTSNNKVKL